MKISRRDFVAYSSGLLSCLVPFLGSDKNLLHLKDDARIDLSNQDNHRKILVLIQLAGGNDWFNTVIPYKEISYYRSRPSIAISSEKSIKLDQQYALHPNLYEIKKLYDQQQVAILLNTGYAQTTLSHYKANENLQYASCYPNSKLTWQGHYANYMHQQGIEDLIFPTISVQPQFSKLAEDKIASQEQIFVSDLTANNKFEFDLDNHYRLNEYSGNVIGDSVNGFSSALNLTAKLIMNKTNATIFNISLGGFDTHTNQSAKHAHLLAMLSKAIYSFQSGLEKDGVADRVLTLVCSEFGRSYKENNDLGTDHGYQNHILAIGKPVKGGIYGKGYGRAFSGDYAQLQATYLAWLSCRSKAVVTQKREVLPFI